MQVKRKTVRDEKDAILGGGEHSSVSWRMCITGTKGETQLKD